MSLRADMYRQKAAEAKQSAARARNPFIKSAFEAERGTSKKSVHQKCIRRSGARLACVLAEQIAWMENQKVSTPERDD
jgi:hypothetical protein